jgi:hypothetical protein
MPRICGFDLDLVIQDVLPTETRGGSPAIYSAGDGGGGYWPIVRVEDEPLTRTCCAPRSPSERFRPLWMDSRHRQTRCDTAAPGLPSFSPSTHGRAVRDRCLLGAQVTERLPAVSGGPALVAAL